MSNPVSIKSLANVGDLNHTVKNTDALALMEQFKGMRSPDIARELNAWEGNTQYNELLIKATEIVGQRAEKAKDVDLEKMISLDVPAWIKSVAITEQNARAKRRAVKAETEREEKAEQSQEKKLSKPRKRKASSYRGKLLKPCRHNSIFKIKYQFANLTNYKGVDLHWIKTNYSMDYEVERKWFKEDDQFEYLESRVHAEGDKAFALFDKGGIRQGGFNGYTYNMEKVLGPLHEQGKICWCAIYLNRVLEQQPNGEFWSLSLWEWGRMKPVPNV